MPTWLTIILALGGSTLISCIIQLIFQRTVIKRVNKKDQLEKELNEQHKAELEELNMYRRKEELEELKSVIVNTLAPLEQRIASLESTMSALLSSDVLSLRCNMKVILERCKEEGCADMGDKLTMSELYQQYKTLGGNHFKECVDDWVDTVKNLPKEKVKTTKSKKVLTEDK